MSISLLKRLKVWLLFMIQYGLSSIIVFFMVFRMIPIMQQRIDMLNLICLFGLYGLTVFMYFKVKKKLASLGIYFND